ncbi:hypothetical protein [Streptomyces atratus]|uniref:hypothetical protein n=1 Tax=Streptomyces atratus TaxID=1893 RepID=UPI0034079E6B
MGDNEYSTFATPSTARTGRAATGTSDVSSMQPPSVTTASATPIRSLGNPGQQPDDIPADFLREN